MSRSAQCPNFAKARFSDIRSRSPRLPPTTAALTVLIPAHGEDRKSSPRSGSEGQRVSIESGPGVLRYACLPGPSSKEAASRGGRRGVPGCPTSSLCGTCRKTAYFLFAFGDPLAGPRPTGVPRPRAKPPLHGVFFPTGTVIVADRGYNRCFSALWREAPCRTGESRRASKADTRVSARGHRANIPPTSRTGGPRCRTGGK
jgi:hypothetical protein